MLKTIQILAASLVFASAAYATPIYVPGDFTPEFVRLANAALSGDAATPYPGAGRDPRVAAVQVALDRAGFSVGVIDGYDNARFRKAIAAYLTARDIEVTGEPFSQVVSHLSATNGTPPLKQYTITKDDVTGPYADKIPEDYAEMAAMDKLAYTSVVEMLAERFHMDIDFLGYLNRGRPFIKPGTTVWVADIGKDMKGVRVKQIVVDVSESTVRAYDGKQRVVAHYPAALGSLQTPSPSGTHRVTKVAIDPSYTYDPTKNPQQGSNTKRLLLPAGPNGPVGNVWIGLSKPTFGLHGTPDPARLDDERSQGCVRLTNWDAQELAYLVGRGTQVVFARNWNYQDAPDQRLPR